MYAIVFSEVINPMRNSLLGALIDFIGYYSKKDRHRYKEWDWKKNDMKRGVFRIHWNIYYGELFRENSQGLKASL